MQSWFKKIREKAKKEKEKERKKTKFENIKIDIVISLALLAYLIILFMISIVNYSNELGFILAILSIIVTLSFEVYEWIYLFKTDKSKKHTLLPAMYACGFFMMFMLTANLYKETIENTKWNNLICSGTLMFYVILITVRKIIEDWRK